jgi:hypothetical protein
MGDRYIKDPTQTVAILCGLGETGHIRYRLEAIKNVEEKMKKIFARLCPACNAPSSSLVNRNDK